MEKFIRVQNLDIAYTETNSNKQNTLLFVHGNSGSKNVYHHQLACDLFKDYRVIAIDLPGHGQSSRCEDEDCYTITWYSKMVKSFINTLNLTSVVLVGHSLGGHVVVGASDKSYTKGLVIFHTPPLNRTYDAAYGFNQSPHFACYLNGEVSPDNVDLLLDATLYNKNAYEPFLLNDFMNTHPSCRTKLGTSAQANVQLSEIDKLKKATFPIAIFTTDHDPIVNVNYIKELNFRLRSGDLVCINEAGHYPQLENPEAFNRELLNFLEDL